MNSNNNNNRVHIINGIPISEKQIQGNLARFWARVMVAHKMGVKEITVKIPFTVRVKRKLQRICRWLEWKVFMVAMKIDNFIEKFRHK